MDEPYIVQIAGARGGKTDSLVKRTVDAIREAMPAEVVVRGELDAAWAEVEAALPEGWAILQLHHTAMMDQRWQAEAQSRVGPVVMWNKVRTVIAEGLTPAAALRALAAKLPETGR